MATLVTPSRSEHQLTVIEYCYIGDPIQISSSADYNGVVKAPNLADIRESMDYITFI